MNDQQMTRDRLEALIERYFEGETTADEEALLRCELANDRWHDVATDEARFVMGYYSLAKTLRNSSKNRGRTWLREWAVAASIAILLMAGVGLRKLSNSQCTAWVGGKAIHDQEQVMNLITADLDAMQGVGDELQGDMMVQIEMD